MLSTIGTKLVVAVTGVLLVLFVIGHMLGNLQIYLGPEAVNSYAAFLKSKPGPLWGIRLGLLAVFLLHIGGIIRLTLANKRARSTAYAMKKPVQSTLASRTMVYSGAALLCLRRLPPAALHDRGDPSGVFPSDGQRRAARCLFDDHPRFSATTRFDLLHLCDGVAGDAPGPWCGEHLSEHRLEAASTCSHDRGVWPHRRRRDRARQHLYPLGGVARVDLTDAGQVLDMRLDADDPPRAD